MLLLSFCNWFYRFTCVALVVSRPNLQILTNKLAGKFRFNPVLGWLGPGDNFSGRFLFKKKAQSMYSWENTWVALGNHSAAPRGFPARLVFRWGYITRKRVIYFINAYFQNSLSSFVLPVQRNWSAEVKKKRIKYLYLYSVVVLASSWWGRVGGMPIESRQVRKGKPIGVASRDESLPTTAGRGNRTHDPLVRCFIADSGPRPQTSRPPTQL